MSRAPAPHAAQRLGTPGFAARLLAWYRPADRDLPWRGVDDAWAVWVSEVMLQQTRVEVIRDGVTLIPEHLSKAQDIALKPGDRVRVRTPGGGGYGPPAARNPALVAEDVRLGRYSAADAARLWPSP